VKYSGTYIQVSDFEKSVKFFEEVLQTRVSIYSPGRWADAEGFGIYCSKYDDDNGIPSSSIERVFNTGNGIIIELYTENIEAEYQRLKCIVPRISELCYLNIQAPYHYFHFKDPDGNMFEVGYFPEGMQLTAGRTPQTPGTTLTGCTD